MCSHFLASQHNENHWHEVESAATEHVVGFPEVGVPSSLATPNVSSFASARFMFHELMLSRERENKLIHTLGG